jgi:hypothetical protein
LFQDEVRAFHLGEEPPVVSHFVAEDEGEGRIREAYPGSTYERLAEIKGCYDPTNLFRLNQNIPPATEGRTTEQKETSDG